MDAGQFDAVLLACTAVPSRRGVARTLTALGLSLMFGPLAGRSDVEDKRK